MNPDVHLPQGSVVITPNEMYREMQDISRKVDHLTSVLDPWQAEVRSDIGDTKTQLAEMVAERKAEVRELRQRVGSLENWRWFLLGLGAPLGTLGGFALTRIFGA